jgi:hypothetical protein
MENNESLRCRLAACREALHDGKQWSFYLLNDNDFPLDFAVLYEIGYEWGDIGSSESTDARIVNLASGAHALIWRDDGSGAELRMELFLRIAAGGRETKLSFEFPRLYRKQNPEMVEGLGKPGWQAEASRNA